MLCFPNLDDRELEAENLIRYKSVGPAVPT